MVAETSAAVESSGRFASLDEFRAAHARLLMRHRESGRRPMSSARSRTSSGGGGDRGGAGRRRGPMGGPGDA